MKKPQSFSVWAYLACLTLFPAVSLAETSDPAANLWACKKGWSSCDHRRLTLSEITEVAVADHAVADLDLARL